MLVGFNPLPISTPPILEPLPVLTLATLNSFNFPYYLYNCSNPPYMHGVPLGLADVWTWFLTIRERIAYLYIPTKFCQQQRQYFEKTLTICEITDFYEITIIYAPIGAPSYNIYSSFLTYFFFIWRKCCFMIFPIFFFESWFGKKNLIIFLFPPKFCWYIPLM